MTADRNNLPTFELSLHPLTEPRSDQNIADCRMLGKMPPGEPLLYDPAFGCSAHLGVKLLSGRLFAMVESRELVSLIRAGHLYQATKGRTEKTTHPDHKWIEMRFFAVFTPMPGPTIEDECRIGTDRNIKEDA